MRSGGSTYVNDGRMFDASRARPASISTRYPARVNTVTSWPARAIARTQLQPISSSDPQPGAHAYAETNTLNRYPDPAGRGFALQLVSRFGVSAATTPAATGVARYRQD